MALGLTNTRHLTQEAAADPGNAIGALPMETQGHGPGRPGGINAIDGKLRHIQLCGPLGMVQRLHDDGRQFCRQGKLEGLPEGDPIQIAAGKTFALKLRAPLGMPVPGGLEPHFLHAAHRHPPRELAGQVGHDPGKAPEFQPITCQVQGDIQAVEPDGLVITRPFHGPITDLQLIDDEIKRQLEMGPLDGRVVGGRVLRLQNLERANMQHPAPHRRGIDAEIETIQMDSLGLVAIIQPLQNQPIQQHTVYTRQAQAGHPGASLPHQPLGARLGPQPPRQHHDQG